MKIKELYDSNETITVESYLAKNGVLDIKDFFNPKFDPKFLTIF